MTHRFYGGTRANSNAVRLLNATTFSELVDRYFNRAVQLPVTRQAYHAMPDDDQRAIKNGPYVTACSFTGDTRGNDHADLVELVFLDLDEGGSDYHTDPRLALDALAPWNCLLYATASSTPAAPRLRVVVEADRLPVGCHREAVNLVADRLGLPPAFKGRTESGTLSQPMFRPVLFEGETDSPVLCSRTNGRALTSADLMDAGVELDAAGNPVARHSTSRVYGCDVDDGGCGLDQLPIFGLSVEDVRPALFAIDPDVDYPVWVQVATALRHQFRREDDAEDAYHMFDEWSASGSKYRGEAETWAKWKSFRPDASGRSVTVRTLLHEARKAGWSPATFSKRLGETYDQWLEAATVEVLLEEGPGRIAAMPELNDLQESSMVSALAKALRSRGHPVDKVALNRAIRKAKSVRRAEKNKDDDVEPWLRPYCYHAPADKFVHTSHGMATALTPAAFDRTFARELVKPEDSGVPSVLPSQYALNVRKIKPIYGTVYDPRNGGDEPYHTWNGLDYLNEYDPASVPRMDVVNSEWVGEAFLNHLRTIIGEKEYQDLLLHFIAHIVQRPGQKIRWVYAIQSAEGVGKTLLSDMIGKAIGPRNVKIVNPNAMMSGPWNDWASNCQLLVLEELRVQGKNRSDVMNRLKDLITNNELTIVEKFRSVRHVPNVVNCIAFSNYHDFLYLEESSRRYAVVKSPIQSRPQVDELVARGHFDLLKAISQEHGGALRHFLMNVEIPDTFPTDGPAPRTIYAESMVEESKNRLRREIEDRIESGDPLIGRDVVDLAHLEAEVAMFLRDAHPPRHYLIDLGYRQWGNRRIDFDGHRTEVFYHPLRFDDTLETPAEALAARRGRLMATSI
jgi:hypothetical protein